MALLPISPTVTALARPRTAEADYCRPAPVLSSPAGRELGRPSPLLLPVRLFCCYRWDAVPVPPRSVKQAMSRAGRQRGGGARWRQRGCARTGSSFFFAHVHVVV